MNLTKDLFESIPYRVGNIVEVNKDRHLTYGKIEEVSGRFKDDALGKNITIFYRINNEMVSHELVTRKVSEQ